MTLADWPLIPAGTKAIVTEIYHEGIMLEWQSGEYKSYAIGRNEPRMPQDGFSRDDMRWLAFASKIDPSHPSFNAEVYNINYSRK